MDTTTTIAEARAQHLANALSFLRDAIRLRDLAARPHGTWRLGRASVYWCVAKQEARKAAALRTMTKAAACTDEP